MVTGQDVFELLILSCLVLAVLTLPPPVPWLGGWYRWLTLPAVDVPHPFLLPIPTGTRLGRRGSTPSPPHTTGEPWLVAMYCHPF